MDDYENMGTGELRKLIRERGLGSGLALSSANKETCVSLLKGEITWDEVKARVQQAPENASASSGASTCQQSAGTAAPNADAMAQVMAGLAALMPRGGLSDDDRYEVKKIACEQAVEAVKVMVDAELDARLKPTRVELVNRETQEVKALGVCHKTMPTLLALCQARDKDGHVPPVYLYGPAGTGKTTAARKVAEALGLKFYYNGAVDSEYKLSGFIDAGGVFRSRPFYEAYANGGVYLFDELDSSMPGAVLAFNAALANGYADFPCGNVPRHKDCIILAAGNTCMRGDGGQAGFQRMKQDSAFRDRFCFLEWAIDEALEQSIADSYGDEWGWLGMVRRWRASAAAHGLRDFEVTPRATDRGLAMLKAGVPLSVVTDVCVRKGLGEDAWRKVNG